MGPLSCGPLGSVVISWLGSKKQKQGRREFTRGGLSEFALFRNFSAHFSLFRNFRFGRPLSKDSVISVVISFLCGAPLGSSEAKQGSFILYLLCCNIYLQCTLYNHLSYQHDNNYDLHNTYYYSEHPEAERSLQKPPEAPRSPPKHSEVSSSRHFPSSGVGGENEPSMNKPFSPGAIY